MSCTTRRSWRWVGSSDVAKSNSGSSRRQYTQYLLPYTKLLHLIFVSKEEENGGGREKAQFDVVVKFGRILSQNYKAEGRRVL